MHMIRTADKCAVSIYVCVREMESERHVSKCISIIPFSDYFISCGGSTASTDRKILSL